MFQSQSSSAVYIVVFSLKRFLESLLIWSGFFAEPKKSRTVTNGNLTLVFHARVVATKTDGSVTSVFTVRINKQEANLAARPETLINLMLMYGRLFY